MPEASTIERMLRDRIAELEEENRQLREALIRAPRWPRKLDLTPRLERLLSALWAANGEFLPRERLTLATWELDPGGHNFPVAMYQLRRKLQPLGVRIENWPCHGWALRNDNRDRLKAALI